MKNILSLSFSARNYLEWSGECCGFCEDDPTNRTLNGFCISQYGTAITNCTEQREDLIQPNSCGLAFDETAICQQNCG